jgi:hypothetical protein
MELEDALITVLQADEKAIENLEGSGKNLIREIREEAA